MADEEDFTPDNPDYSAFSPTGGGQLSQDLPTGTPGGEAIPSNGTFAQTQTPSAVPAGNPMQPEWQLPVANVGNVPTQQGGTGALPSYQAKPMGPDNQPGPIAAAILSYLHGDGAADPAVVEQVEQQIDPDGSMDDGERHLRAIQAAHQQGGPEAAWSFVQKNRQDYNGKMAFANAALTGTQGKPPDLQAAAQAATDAYSHVPDGKRIEFAANSTGDGVTATVTGRDGQTQTQPLTTDQFKQMVNIGGDGLYDKVFQTGWGTIGQRNDNNDPELRALTGQSAPSKMNYVTGSQGANEDDEDASSAGGGPNPAQRPGGKPQVYGTEGGPPVPADHSRGRTQTFGEVSPDAGYDTDLVARARNIFPMAGQTQQRNAWLAKVQEARDAAEAENKNKLDVENVKGNTQRDIWGTRAGATVAASQNRKEGMVGAAGARANTAVQVAQIQAAARSGDARANAVARMINGWQNGNPNQNVPQEVIDRALQTVTTAQGQQQGGGQAQGVVQKTLKNGQKVNVRQVAPGKWQIVQ